VARVPDLLGRVSAWINGPIPYSPDGNPLSRARLGLSTVFHLQHLPLRALAKQAGGEAIAETIVQASPKGSMGRRERRYGAYADRGLHVDKAMSSTE